MAGLRIYICGPHSTGKTTLLNDVRPHLPGVTVIDEVARTIIRNHGWTRDQILPDKHPDVFFKLNQEILKEQIKLDLLNRKTITDVIFDRALDPIVYCRFYLGERAARQLLATDGVDTWLERMRNSLVLLITPHRDCIADDSVRLTSSLAELQRLCDAFEAELSRHNIYYCKIAELDRQKRVEIVLKEVNSRRPCVEDNTAGLYLATDSSNSVPQS